MRKYKLSNLSFAFIFISILHSSILGIIIPYMLYEAKTSVFTSLVLGYFIGLLLILLYFKVFDFEPDKNIFEKIEYATPKCISKPLEFLFGLVVFFIAFVTFYRLTTFISSQFLVNTPNILIACVLIVPVMYACLYDFDVIARMATVCVFIGFILVIMSSFFLSENMDLQNLKPILNNDFIHLSRSSLTFALVYLTPIFSTLAIPKDSIIDNQKTKKYILSAYSISFISLCTIIFMIITVLGINVATLYTYPSYITLKVLNVLEFLKNIEHVNATIWILYMTFSTSFYLLVIKLLFHHTFNLNLKKINTLTVFFIVLPFLIMLVLALPYEGYVNKNNSLYVMGAIMGIILVIVSLVLVLGKIKNHKKKASYSI